MNKIKIFDSTLRDGAQGEGISFTVQDKIRILQLLDEFGVQYIEAGNPGSNPKDIEFFQRAANLELKQAKLTAFGSTRRKEISPDQDTQVMSLLSANTQAVAIFGKCWDLHVTEIIKTTLEENLAMIEDTIRFFVEKGKEVTFDAEHFFDGYKANPTYAIKALQAAEKGGASYLALCDTNGGTFSGELRTIIEAVQGATTVPLGIHCHNDSGMAVANSIVAAEMGVEQIQGTFIGYGERCGNANLSVIIPNLMLKMKTPCLASTREEPLEILTETARKVAEVMNVTLSSGTPYIGKSAFAHKGGMHIDGVSKVSHSFEHVPPGSVGNERRFLMSEMAGRSTFLSRMQRIVPGIDKESPEAKALIQELKDLEHQGYQFEGAESSFDLVMRRHLGEHLSFFTLDHYRITEDKPSRDPDLNSTAVVKVLVEGQEEINAAQGDGPVHALDRALRKALERFYPAVSSVKLIDYKVRVIDSKAATAAKVRVVIESTDGKSVWSTVGVSTDIIAASWLALRDSLEYKLLLDSQEGAKESV